MSDQPSIGLSITESQIFSSLRTFLLQILPADVAVIRGRQNRVPMPQGPFVTMTPLFRRRLMTNVDTWAFTPNPISLTVATATQVDVQLDCYGIGAADNAQIISTLFRDDFGYEALHVGGVDISPLYAGEARNMDFVNGEDQYEPRCIVDVALQINPVLSVRQDFAETANVVPVSVEATYAP